MHPSTPQTTTLEIIQAYFKQINPPPPSASPFQHPQHRIWAQIQKFTCTLLFASSNPFQNGMTQPGGIKNHKVITFQA